MAATSPLFGTPRICPRLPRPRGPLQCLHVPQEGPTRLQALRVGLLNVVLIGVYHRRLSSPSIMYVMVRQRESLIVQ